MCTDNMHRGCWIFHQTHALLLSCPLSSHGDIHEKLKKNWRIFYSFLRAYKPERAVVFTDGEFGVRKISDTLVAFVPLFYA